jgi:hypothetical protein
LESIKLLFYFFDAFDTTTITTPKRMTKITKALNQKKSFQNFFLRLLSFFAQGGQNTFLPLISSLHCSVHPIQA